MQIHKKLGNGLIEDKAQQKQSLDEGHGSRNTGQKMGTLTQITSLRNENSLIFSKNLDGNQAPSQSFDSMTTKNMRLNRLEQKFEQQRLKSKDRID